MLGQYKKIASGTFSLNKTFRKADVTRIFQDSNNSNNDIYEFTNPIKVPLNLDFKPSIFYINIPDSGYVHSLCNKLHYEKQNKTDGIKLKNVNIRYGNTWAYIAKVEQENAEINFCVEYSSFNSYTVKFIGECEWIAIG